MRKILILIIVAVMLVMQTGCTMAGSEIVLESDPSEPLKEEMPISDVVESPSSEEENGVIYDDSFTESEKELPVVVYVCGAVLETGVYELPPGSRLADAVKAAGGFDEDANDTYVNLAAECIDGMKLYIPTTSETEASKSLGTTGSLQGSEDGRPESFDISGGLANADTSVAGLVNINTASKEELTTLSGIGAGYADRIIAYRNEKGPFRSIEDIMKVSGIKEKLFSKIKDQITV